MPKRKPKDRELQKRLSRQLETTVAQSNATLRKVQEALLWFRQLDQTEQRVERMVGKDDSSDEEAQLRHEVQQALQAVLRPLVQLRERKIRALVALEHMAERAYVRQDPVKKPVTPVPVELPPPTPAPKPPIAPAVVIDRALIEKALREMRDRQQDIGENEIPGASSGSTD